MIPPSVAPYDAVGMRCAYCSTTPTSRPPLHQHQKLQLSHRSLFYLSTTIPFSTPLSSSAATPDTSITDRVFLDLSLCSSYFQSRTLGEYDLSLCTESELFGRLFLGLYGNLIPITVSNFKAMCTGSSGKSYKGTSIHKIFPGEFLSAGRQGRKDKGEVTPPVELVRNTNC